MISENEVKRIAQLARLGLKKSEIKKFQKELSLILDYIEKLKEADIADVGFYSSEASNVNTTRRDKKREKEKAKPERLSELFPEEKKGFLKVKQVL